MPLYSVSVASRPLSRTYMSVSLGYMGFLKFPCENLMFATPTWCWYLYTLNFQAFTDHTDQCITILISISKCIKIKVGSLFIFSKIMQGITLLHQWINFVKNSFCFQDLIVFLKKKEKKKKKVLKKQTWHYF